MCQLDYSNSLLFCIPDDQLQRLQAIQNATARLVSGARRSDHITPVLRHTRLDHMTLLLRELHWLKVPERVKFRLCADVPLPQRYRTPLPCRDHPSSH